VTPPEKRRNFVSLISLFKKRAFACLLLSISMSSFCACKKVSKQGEKQRPVVNTTATDVSTTSDTSPVHTTADTEETIQATRENSNSLSALESTPCQSDGCNDLYWCQDSTGDSVCDCKSITLETEPFCWRKGNETGTTFSYSPLIQLSLGNHVSYGLRADGRAQCWGGQFETCPMPPAGITFKQLAIDADYGCGLLEDGTIHCWGEDHARVLNERIDNTYTNISAANQTLCAVQTDGAVQCWQLGGALPSLVTADVPFVQIAAGTAFKCGLKSDGTIDCWGANQGVQHDAPEGDDYIQVVAGADYVCGLKQNGNVTCLEQELNWTLGSVTSPPADGSFVKISGGEYTVCGLRDNGTVSCWGFEADDGMKAPTDETFVDVAVGYSHACGLRDDGTARCWSDRMEAEEVTPVNSQVVTDISVGMYTTCWVEQSGDLKCRGCQRGLDGSVPDFCIPPSGSDFERVYLGQNWGCAVTHAGDNVCWGDTRWTDKLTESIEQMAMDIGSICVLLNGGQIRCADAQTELPTSLVNEEFIHVSCAPLVCCGVQTDHTVACWGETDDISLPATEDVRQVELNDQGVGVLLDDERVAWWHKESGVTVITPNDVPISQLVPSPVFACGLQEDGTLICWGESDDSELLPPTQIRFSKISCDSSMRLSCCGLEKESGREICWGSDTRNLWQ
jgi:alpha-tubulin suppressor-like RCC1 family protein